jgi:hypothetical protein
LLVQSVKMIMLFMDIRINNNSICCTVHINEECGRAQYVH